MTLNAGGAATFQGTDYQARIAAWLAARALSGNSAAPLWDWPQDSQIRSIWMETDDSVDDIRVDGGSAGSAFIQAKHHVSVSNLPISAFGKAMQQFVAQYESTRTIDRLVLVAASGSSRRVLETLPAMLQRARLTESGSVDEICRNADERSLHATLLEVVNASWVNAYGRVPASHEFTGFLGRLHVTRIDPYQDQAEAREAKQLLRGRLRTPSQAATAWDALISEMSRVAILRSRVTPAWILSMFQDVGIAVNIGPAFERDVEVLRGWSDDVARRLEGFTAIVGDDGLVIQIERDFAPELSRVAQGSCLITGDAGAGKSGCLRQLAVDLGSDSDIVFLAADSLRAHSLAGLGREIGLENGLADIFSAWTGSGPGYLIIDALDAGRGSESQRALLELIEVVVRSRGRWQVVATVRRFDLRYNLELQDLFRGETQTPLEYQSPEFLGIRHFHVPEMSSLELQKLATSAPILRQRIAESPIGLQHLLGNMFCLRLFADLVHELPRGEAIDMSSRNNLLERFWQRRAVSYDPMGASSEAALRQIIQTIVDTGTLTVARSSIITADSATTVARLLQAGVLAEGRNSVTGARTIGFAHHVLFDFAASVLLLREGGVSLSELVVENRTLLFLARPSFQMHLEYLWELSEDRLGFWRVVLELARTPGVPEIARVIGPGIAADAIREPGDYQQLLEAVERDRPVALNVVRHLVVARLNDTRAPESWHPAWALLLDQISRAIDLESSSLVRSMLHSYLSVPSTALTPVVSRAARSLLRWCWALPTTDRWFLHPAIHGVAMAFESEPEASEPLLREILQEHNLRERGFVDLPLLAQRVDRIWSHAPDLARDIFSTAFSFEETSSAPTPITTGVLSMSSNRKQDYEMAHHALAEHFPAFLDVSPSHAIEALEVIAAKYSSRYGHVPDRLQIPWDGRIVHILDDHYFWATDRHGDEEAQLLDAFDAWISVDSEDAYASERRLLALEVFLRTTAPAALWRSLLSSLPSHDQTLELVAPLLLARSALLSIGLAQPIGSALQRGFTGITLETRAEIESAIEDLDVENEDGPARRAQARFVACLPPEELRSVRLTEILRDLIASETVPENRPPAIEVRDADRVRHDYLSDSGIDPELPANARVLELRTQVERFVSTFLNEVPSSVAVAPVWAVIVRLKAALLAPDTHTKLVKWSFDDIARALAIASRGEWTSSLDADDLARLAQVVLELSALPAPPDPSPSDSQSWSPAARPLAAETMLRMVRAGAGDGVRERVLEMTEDPSVYVRVALVRHAALVLEADKAATLAILACALEYETSGAVLRELLVLVTQVGADPDEIWSNFQSVYDRGRDLGDVGESVRVTACSLAIGHYIWRGSLEARQFIRDRFDDPSTPAYEVDAFQNRVRSGFESSEDGGAIRRRAFEIALEVQELTVNRFETVRASNDAVSDDLEAARASSKAWAQIIEGLGNDVYHGSGAYVRGEEDPRRSIPVDDYYEAAKPLLRALLSIPFPSVVHNVVRTLDHLSPADPRGIFIEIAGAVVKGREGGYEYDLTGEPTVVAIVSRYLAKDRGLFQTDEGCRDALLRVLDILVAAGSGSAITLTYQLQEVFR